MSFTGLDVMDNTIQKTNLWLKDVMQELGTEDKHRAFLALRAVLHMLRDRLLVDEVAEFASQLPLFIRGLYYEGWEPSTTPKKERHRAQFLSHVKEYFINEPEIDSEKVVRAVFSVFAKRISQGEINDIKGLFPMELQDLWPQEAAAESAGR